MNNKHVRITPQQQLWSVTSDKLHVYFQQVFRRLKKRDQEDMCLALVAYVRFGIRRPFVCPFMQAMFDSFVEMIEMYKL